MKPSRKARLWLADRNPWFDTPSVYRRPPSGPERERRWADAFLLGGFGLSMLGCSFLLLLFSLFGLYVVGYTIFHS